MKGDTVGILRKLEHFHQVPRNRFSFAVFISCEPNSISLGGGFFELVDDFGVVGVNFVSNIKSFFIDLGILADVAYRSQDMKVLTEVFLDSMGFGRRLDDN